MKRMNLLPADYKAQTRFTRMLRIQMILFSAALILLLASMTIPASILQERQAWLNELEQQTEHLQFMQTEALAESILVLEHEIAATQLVLQELRKVPQADIGMYRKLVDLLPPGTHLQSFHLLSDTCTASGQAASRAEVVAFVALIESLDTVKEVQLRSLGLEKDQNPVEFTIEIVCKTEERTE